MITYQDNPNGRKWRLYEAWTSALEKMVESGSPKERIAAKKELYIRSKMRCKHCSGEISFNYTNAHDLRKFRECFKCNHFMKLARREDRSNCVVAKHLAGTDTIHHYMIGDEKGGPFRGFGGSKFVIRFTDGRVVTTTNLWHQGQIPDHLLKHFPINAEFDHS